MKIQQYLITSCLLLSTLTLSAGTVPELKYHLENMDEQERLSWAYEVAYRLSDYQNKIASGEIQANNEVFCNIPPVTSEQIIGYLNKHHANEHITDNQALDTIFVELETAYPCS